MRTNSIIIVVVLFFVIVGAIIFIYFKYEKPKEENQVYLIDLAIFAKEEEKLVRTNYSIYVNGFYLGSGLTNEYDATLYKVPFNSTITIINSNLLEQKYYKNRIDLFTDKNETTRVVIDLVSVGNLTINSTKENYKINTTISTEDYFKNMLICLDWSIHVIFADIQNMTKTTNINNHTKCYQGPTLNKQNFNFIINYQTFGTVNKDDYIDVIFYDFDENYIRRQEYRNILI